MFFIPFARTAAVHAAGAMPSIETVGADQVSPVTARM